MDTKGGGSGLGFWDANGLHMPIFSDQNWVIVGTVSGESTGNESAACNDNSSVISQKGYGYGKYSLRLRVHRGYILGR